MTTEHLLLMAAFMAAQQPEEQPKKVPKKELHPQLIEDNTPAKYKSKRQQSKHGHIDCRDVKNRSNYR